MHHEHDANVNFLNNPVDNIYGANIDLYYIWLNLQDYHIHNYDISFITNPTLISDVLDINLPENTNIQRTGLTCFHGNTKYCLALANTENTVGKDVVFTTDLRNGLTFIIETIPGDLSRKRLVSTIDDVEYKLAYTSSLTGVEKVTNEELQDANGELVFSSLNRQLYTADIVVGGVEITSFEKFILVNKNTTVNNDTDRFIINYQDDQFTLNVVSADLSVYVRLNDINLTLGLGNEPTHFEFRSVTTAPQLDIAINSKYYKYRNLPHTFNFVDITSDINIPINYHVWGNYNRSTPHDKFFINLLPLKCFESPLGFVPYNGSYTGHPRVTRNYTNIIKDIDSENEPYQLSFNYQTGVHEYIIKSDVTNTIRTPANVGTSAYDPVSGNVVNNTVSGIYPFDKLNINDASITNNGFIANNRPELSTRIFYEKNTNNNSPLLRNGQLLCTWLSASNLNDTPVWIDRYYNPDIISNEDAIKFEPTSISLSAEVYDLNDNFSYTNVTGEVFEPEYSTPNNTLTTLTPASSYLSSGILDKVSDMVFVPAATYTIFQPGHSIFNSYINEHIDSNNIIDEYRKVIDNEATLVQDTSINIPFDGKTFASISPTEFNLKDYTIHFELETDDWGKTLGSLLVSNYDGNIHIFNDTKLTTYNVTCLGRKISIRNTNNNIINEFEIVDDDISDSTFFKKIILSDFTEYITLIRWDGVVYNVHPAGYIVDRADYKDILGTSPTYEPINITHVHVAGNEALIQTDDVVKLYILNLDTLNLTEADANTNNLLAVSYGAAIDGDPIEFNTKTGETILINGGNDVLYINESLSVDIITDEDDSPIVYYEGSNGPITNTNILYNTMGIRYIVNVPGVSPRILTPGRVAYVRSDDNHIYVSVGVIDLINSKVTYQDDIAKIEKIDGRRVNFITDTDENWYISISDGSISSHIIKLTNDKRYITRQKINSGIISLDFSNEYSDKNIFQLFALSEDGTTLYYNYFDNERLTLVATTEVEIPGYAPASIYANETPFNYDYLRQEQVMSSGNYNNRLFFRNKFTNIFNKELVTRATISYNINELLPGKHTFTLTCNTIAGEYKLYVDGILVATDMFEPYIYRLNDLTQTKFIIGKPGFHNNFTLDEFTGLNNYYNCNGGNLTNFKIINKALLNTDVNVLTINSFNLSDTTLYLPTGVRNYKEEVSKFYHGRVPYYKSDRVNVNLFNFNQTLTPDEQLRQSRVIEEQLTDNLPAQFSIENVNRVEVKYDNE